MNHRYLYNARKNLRTAIPIQIYLYVLCAFFAFAQTVYGNDEILDNIDNISDNIDVAETLDNSGDDDINSADTLGEITSDTLITRDASANITDTVYYEGNRVDYDNEEQILELFGNARVMYQNIILTADTIIYTVSNDQFQARGRPTLIDGNDTTFGDFMVYNIKTRRGRVSYAMTRFDDTFVTGSNIVKSEENHLFIEEGDYTTCAFPEDPHYYFYARHIKVVPEDMVIGRPVVLNIGNAPVAALPYFIMPLSRGRRSGWLTPSWGGSVASGGYIDNLGYYFAPNDYYDLLASTKVQEFNSFVFNARGRYAVRYMLDGQVSGRYVIDNRLENESRQWALDYRHNHLLTPDGKTRMAGRGSILSNRTFNKLYSDNTYELEQQQLDANMSLSHRIESINASTNLTWRRNHNLTTDRIIEDAPTLDFRLQNRAFIPFRARPGRSDPAWYNNIFFGYNAKATLRRDIMGNDSTMDFLCDGGNGICLNVPPDTIVTRNAHNSFTLPGMEHNFNITSSQKLFRYLDVSPYFNMRASMFNHAIDTASTQTDTLRHIVTYAVSNLSRDTRYPTYTIDNIDTVYNINSRGEPDTSYIITKFGPRQLRHMRDTTYNEFHLVHSWNTGVNLSTRIYGMFPTHNIFGVTAIRHTMTPTVGYAFVPKHDLDYMFHNIGINYERARERNQQLMNLSLSNRFEGKRIVRGEQQRPATQSQRRRDDNPFDRREFDETLLGERSVVLDNTTEDAETNETLTETTAADTTLADTTQSATRQERAAAPREQKFEILNLTLSTAYDFEATERNWRDLALTASTSVSIINANYTANFWLYDENDVAIAPTMRNYNFTLTSRNLRLGGTLWDGDLTNVNLVRDNAAHTHGQHGQQRRAGGASSAAQDWNFGISPNYSLRASRATTDAMFVPVRSFNVSASADLRFTNALSVRWNGNYDFSSDRFSHNNFTFHYDLECWEMRFTWRPERINPGFHFVVNVKNIPDIKWEERQSRSSRVL